MTALADIALTQVPVLDSTMAYREAGSPSSPTVLFLHGNPTSSYIWRNIIPLVAPVAHCIAPDLIGFGQSGKPDIEYRFFDHVRYLDAFLQKMGISSAYVVAQDWGTGLAFHLSARRPESIRAWHSWNSSAQCRRGVISSRWRSKSSRSSERPVSARSMILDENAFVERVLPASMVRKLTEAEMAVYRSPFPTPESRRPTWRFPNDLPIAGEPGDVYATIEEAHRALAESSYPKLLFVGDPGALVSPAFAESFANGLKNCGLIHLGPGLHYLQEDNPQEIGSAVHDWVKVLETAARS